ncbi:MAG: type II secretion system minor pseudopilin GspH [Proteobacteria bacterium]|nr:type II secretion system minor pseudopilin GspH [Pseudomonadota bacterium]MBU1716972.1 type II secretion system minor pseudopilin GspH [Pseudomonadota bacterium]
MPISVTGTLKNKKAGLTQQGFTLLELIVVVLLIGIITSFVTLSIGSRSDKIDTEARRLVALLNLAGDEAVMSAREYAADFTPTTYRFMEYGRDGWQDLGENGDDVLRSRSLAEGISFKLEIAGEPVDFERSALVEERKDPVGIFLFSSGEVSPFEITITDSYSGVSRVVSNLIDGRARLADPGLSVKD